VTGAHTETTQVPGRRLGRKPKQPGRPLLRLADILTGEPIPAHASAADHFAEVTDWQMWANDQYGDCGPASVANSRAITTTYLAGGEHVPTLDDVFDLYRRSGNPDFNPDTGADDNGVIMADMLSAVLSGGIGGVRGLAYAAVDTTSIDEVRAAIDIFGYVLLGVDLQTAQQRQTDRGLWDYSRSGEWGGHAVIAGRYTGSAATRTADVGVVTWGEVVGTTDAFFAKQVDEAYVLIWPENVGTAQFRAGIDVAALNSAYMALTGRPGPFTEPSPDDPTPTPGPTDPPSSAPDGVLADAMRAWLAAKGL
jgi:hypothetical protein